MDEDRISRASTSISAATMLSRILGYIRDMVIANYFGANYITDAFYLAYRIPNLLRRIVGEGALSSSFVPIFTGYISSGDDEKALSLFRKMFTIVLSFLLVTTILGIIFTPQLLYVIAPGFTGAGEEVFSLTVNLTRIMFPFMIAVGISALFLGVLNSLKRFFIPAVSPCFLSIGEIFFVLAICPMMPPEKRIYGLAFGVIAGIFMATFFQYPFISRLGYSLKLVFDFKDEGVISTGRLIGPATLAYSVDQINAFVDVWFATWLVQGSVSALYYSSHLMQFPLAVFGTAVAIASLPHFSECAAKNDLTGLKTLIKKSISSMFYLILPASAGLIILGRQIITVLFQRGKFGIEATILTNQAMMFYSIGIFAYAGVKIAVAAFYSLKDSKTPVRVTFISFFINFGLNWLFALKMKMGVGGLALASSISSVFNLVYLFYLLRKKAGPLGMRETGIKIIKMFSATLVMGGIVYITGNVVFKRNDFVAIAVSIPSGAVVYLLMAKLLGVFEYNPFRILQRK